MKFREFRLKGDINQREYVTFRTKIQEYKPDAWEVAERMPEELYLDILVRSAAAAGWVEDVEETNEYDDTVTYWSWSENGQSYLDGLPASGKSPIIDWGIKVFQRWTEIRTLDPN